MRFSSLSSIVLPAVVVGSVGLVGGCGDKPAVEVPDDVLGHCEYENPFAKQPECREFRGSGWTQEEAEASCADEDAALSEGPCPYDAIVGYCVTAPGDGKVLQYVTPGDDASKCAGNERACELFAGGSFTPGNTCGGESPVDVDDAYDPDNYYTPETLACIEPLPGEQAGTGAGGQVCTWQHVGGCTEEGRRFEDYASCDVVRTQRPYHPVPANDTEPADDVRMQGPTYAAEVSWVKTQIESCGCVCCHKGSVTPEGAGVFDTEFPGNFANSFTPYGLAFAARAFDSSPLGVYPAADNNGFGRDVAGIPSTDQERMRRFFLGELEHRGIPLSDWTSLTPQPDIFYRQATYEPTACEDGEGVDVDGNVHWTGGRARYLYVLDETAHNPTVPPSGDKPEGTLWRVDTVPPAVPLKTGEVVYGAIPEGHKQTLPVDGAAPAPLVVGQTYLLFAFADIGVPMTRCLFTYGE